MDSRERLARVLYEQWLLGEYPDTDLADQDWNWATIPQAWQIVRGHRKEYCRDFWLDRADAILASDWLRDTLAAERERCAKGCDGREQKHRTDADKASAAGTTPPFGSVPRIVTYEIGAIRNLEPEQPNGR